MNVPNQAAFSQRRWLAITISIAIAVVVGWAWWTSAGPFRENPASERQPLDSTEDVLYVIPQVQFRYFNADINSGTRETRLSQRKKRIFFPNPRSVKEANIYLSAGLEQIIVGAGFQTLPYSTPQKSTVERYACATVSGEITTFKHDGQVAFQVEASLARYVRASFRKPTLLYTTIESRKSLVYSVDEKDALPKMKEVLNEEVKAVFSDARREYFIPYSAQQSLDPAP